MEAKDPFLCAERGDVDFFKTIPPEILLKARDEDDSSTVLTVAALNGRLDCCEVIVERCTSLLYHQDNSTNRSVLHKVVAYQGDNNLENIMRFLITADSKPDLELGGGGKIPNKRLLKMQDITGDTALHLAVRESNHWATELLLEADRDFELLRMVDEDGLTCLHIAADKGDHVSAKFIVRARHDNEFLKMTPTSSNQTALHIAVFRGNLVVAKLLLEADHSNDLLAMVDSQGQTPYMIATQRMLSDEHRECSESDLEMICMLLEKDPKQCTKLEGEREQPFIHAAIKLGLNDVVEKILKSNKIGATILNMQDKDGNTPLHIAALSQNKRMGLCLLYDERVSKEIKNNSNEVAIDLINFSYDEAKARIYCFGSQSDLKDKSNFDMLVAALITTISFTAGMTVPGGYVSDGPNKGSAILLKATAVKIFVISNNFAFFFSLYTLFFFSPSSQVLLKEEDIYYDSKTGAFRTKILLKKKNLIHQLNTATLCRLSAVHAMVAAFISGSYAVWANTNELASTVGVTSCFFLIFFARVTWTMTKQYCSSKRVTGVSS